MTLDGTSVGVTFVVDGALNPQSGSYNKSEDEFKSSFLGGLEQVYPF